MASVLQSLQKSVYPLIWMAVGLDFEWPLNILILYRENGIIISLSSTVAFSPVLIVTTHIRAICVEWNHWYTGS